MNLTQAHKTVLKEVENGADVWGFIEARLLRQCESAGLVTICEAMADPPGEQRQPYFGCIITAKGRRALTAKKAYPYQTTTAVAKGATKVQKAASRAK